MLLVIVYISAMRTLTINLPGSLELDDQEARMVLASKLYELGKLSLSQAAELAGSTKEAFMQSLAEYGVSLINYPSDELDEDIKNAENHSR